MKKSIASILAILSITIYAGVNDTPNDGTSLLDDLTSTSKVVVDAFLNSSNRVHALIESISTAGISLEPATNYTDESIAMLQDRLTGVGELLVVSWSDNAYLAENASTAETAHYLSDEGIAAIPMITTNDVCAIVTNEVTTEWTAWELVSPALPLEHILSINSVYIDGYDWWAMCRETWDGGETIGVRAYPAEQTSPSNLVVNTPDALLYLERERITRNALGLARLSDLPPLTNGLIGADFIATNNPAFVTAVTNCPVVIAEGDAEALAEWGIYGGGGTIGALLAALAAAVAALKKKKMPLYPVGGSGNPVNATYDSGVLTVSPFSMAAYAPTASVAFSVAMGALPSDMESGKARDAVLVIDCTSLTDGQEPTVTWDTHFHPRTDAGTDFACVAGAKNVYYISEYAAGEFAVGGWTETTGGNE